MFLPAGGGGGPRSKTKGLDDLHLRSTFDTLEWSFVHFWKYYQGHHSGPLLPVIVGSNHGINAGLELEVSEERGIQE